MSCSWTVNKPRVSLTSAESEKVRLVGISLQQRWHAAGHALVAFVDEFLAEVVVYLLGCDAVVSRQGAVDELRQLKKERKIILTTNHSKIKNLGGDTVGKKPGWMSSPTRRAPVGRLFVHLLNKQGSKKLWKREGRYVKLPSVLSGSCSTCLWVMSSLMCLHLCKPEGVNVCLTALRFFRSHTDRDRCSWTPACDSGRMSEAWWQRDGGWGVATPIQTQTFLFCLYSLCLNTFVYGPITFLSHCAW